MYATGEWFTEAWLVLVLAPFVYLFLWSYIVGPLNEALGVDL